VRRGVEVLAVGFLALLLGCGPDGSTGPGGEAMPKLDAPLRFRGTIIYVKSVKRTIEFYEKAFGLKRKLVDKGWHYAEMHTGETVLAFGSHLFAKSNLKSPYRKNDPKVKPAGAEIVLKTKYVDAAFERAVAVGAVPLVEPKKKKWGQVVAYVRDLNGFVVAIAGEMDTDLNAGRPQHLYTILAVSDLTRSYEFYSVAFCWDLRVDTPVYKEFLLPNGRGIGLYQKESFARNTGKMPADLPDKAISGTELYFHVPDLADSVRKLEDAGAVKLSDPAPRDWGDEAAYFADPDGNVLVVAIPLPGPELDEPTEPPDSAPDRGR